jgi:phospholipase D1/2
LWKEHLGIPSSDNKISLEDPIDPEVSQLWTKIATDNSKIFREIFPLSANDTMCCFSHEKTTGPSQQESMEKLSRIQGHLIFYPLDFLQDENLSPGIKNVDVMLAQDDIFT